EIKRAEAAKMDVVLIGHHDPRGGHNGKDYPYQFGMYDYKPGVPSKNYAIGEIYNKFACTSSLDWVRGTLAQLGFDERMNSCLHHGLQEWMRPDDFDCADETPRDNDGKCVVDPNATPSATNRYWSSGYALIDKLATHQSVRTLILGHTHYNSLEILQSG